MALQKLKIDFLGIAPAVITLSASSQTVVLPAGIELLGISTTSNCHFRVTPAAQATALASDPLLTPNSEIQILKINPVDTNLSVIWDTAVGNFSYFRVFEA
jgi:hypothetical protein